jgi:hypothetical protein
MLQLLIYLSTQGGWPGEDLVDPLGRNKQLVDMVEHQVVVIVVVLEADTLWGDQPNSTVPQRNKLGPGIQLSNTGHRG